MHPKTLFATVVIGAAVIATQAHAQAPTGVGSGASAERASAKFLKPTTWSSACRTSARHRAACGVIRQFFRAVNARNFSRACSLLGVELRRQDHGLGCERFLAAGSPEPMPWGVLGAKSTGSHIAVLVRLDQGEPDRIRARHHRALVGLEGGRLSILDTRFVR